MSKDERTGWRDRGISARHRLWGVDCPAADLDFLLVEYNLGRPVALVEYKHEDARMPDLKHATYRAIRSLADAAALPFWIAFYSNTDWWFRVYPVNVLAQEHYASDRVMSEREYVTSLYRLRNYLVKHELLANLSDTKPERAAA